MNALDVQLALLNSAEPDLGAERSLLHWFLRHVLGQEDLDTYEYVFDRPRQAAGVTADAAYLAPADDDEYESAVLNLVELTGTSRRDHVRSRVQHVVASLTPASATTRGRAVAEILNQLRVTTSKKIDPATTRIVLHILAPRAVLQNTLQDLTSELVDVQAYDKPRLEQVARAVSSPAAVQGALDIEAASNEIMETAIPSGKVLACPVSARAIVNWPGIEDRTLFDLNVRLKLGGRKVRDSLEKALRDTYGAGDFLAFHNGLTVVCDDAARTPWGLKITNFSVVNGTQSVIAFYESQAHLANDVRVLVKFAAVGTTSSAAREIAIRSNTQNPVTSRNLRALDSRQLTLREEFRQYPHYDYEIRPDAAKASSGKTVIRNDDAAQLLCAVYNERPWLAVKRLTLFEQPHYSQIFSPRITAAHVILVHRIQQAVESNKSQFPSLYQKAWKLTSLVGTYLVGQLLRSNDDLQQLLARPAQHMGHRDVQRLEQLASIAANTLSHRASRYVGATEDDDFKVDFKREDALRSLAGEARRSMRGS